MRSILPIALAGAMLLTAAQAVAAPVDRGLQGGAYNAGRGCCNVGGGGEGHPPRAYGVVPPRQQKPSRAHERRGVQDIGMNTPSHRDDRHAGNNRSNRR